MGSGKLINSNDFNGLNSHEEASSKIIEKLIEIKSGSPKTTYRLRDWLISRQRYWGCPIPLINCKDCGLVPEKLENLPYQKVKALLIQVAQFVEVLLKEKLIRWIHL